MTTTNTLARLRACPAVRELAGDIADSLPFSSHWEQEYEWAIDALTTPTSPLWPYYRAVLRTLAEGRDGRWQIEQREGLISWSYWTPESMKGAPRDDIADRCSRRDKHDHWSCIERGPDEAFLAECCEVLEVTP